MLQDSTTGRRGDHEIEVTSAMIAAGESYIANNDHLLDACLISDGEYCAALFREMAAAGSVRAQA